MNIAILCLLTFAEPVTADKPRVVLNPGGHSAMVTGVEFLNSRQFATIGQDGAVHIWDPRYEWPINTYRMPRGQGRSDGRLFALAVDRKNGRLAVGGTGYVVNGRNVAPIYLIDWVRGRFEGTLNTESDADPYVVSLAFSPDGRYLAAGGQDKTVIYNMATNKVIENGIIGHRGLAMEALTFSAGGTRLACGAGSVVSIWTIEKESLKLIKRYEFKETIGALAWLPGTLRLAVGGKKGTIERWDTSMNTFDKPIKLPNSSISSMVISQDSKTLWGCGRGSKTSVDKLPFVTSLIDLKTWHIEVEKQNSDPHYLNLSPDGTKLAITCGSDFRVAIQSVNGTKDTRLRYFGDNSDRQSNIAWNTKEPLLGWGRVRAGEQAYAYADAELSFTTETGDNYEVNDKGLTFGPGQLEAKFNGQSLRVPSYLDKIRAGCVIRDDKSTSVALTASDCIRLFDGSMGNPVRDLEGGDSAFLNVASSPRGKYVAAIAEDGVVRIWPIDGPNAETYGGIGIITQYVDRKLTITSIVDGSPSEGKLLRGDVLVSATTNKKRTDFQGLNLSEAVKAIRGDIDSIVTLKVARPGEKGIREVTLKRQKVPGAIPVARPLLSIYAKRGEWIAWTEEGYYACSSEGERMIEWQVEKRFDELPVVYRADQFRSAFYRPDIIRLLLKEGSVTAALKAANKKSGQLGSDVMDLSSSQPPEINLQIESQGKRVIATATVTSRSSSPTGEVRLLQDGLAISEPAKKEADGGSTKYVWELNPTNGTHRYMAITTGVSSAKSGKPIVIDIGGKAPKPKLHIGIIWIGDTANKGFNPIHAPKEMADKLSEKLKDRCTSFYEVQKPRIVTNEETTRENIISLIDKIRKDSMPDDVTYIHFVGHTEAEGDSAYLVPYDAVPRKLVTTGISHVDFLRLVGEIKGKRVLIMDTCHAGRIPSGITLEELTKRLHQPGSGLITLYSCRADERSWADKKKLRGGTTIDGPLFTYYLLKGIDGEARIDPVEKAVTINELIAYAREKVRFVSDKEYRQKQTPGYEGQELLDLKLIPGKSGK